jgi:NAD+ synthase
MSSQLLAMENLRAADNNRLQHLLSETDTAIYTLVKQDRITNELITHLVNWLRIKVAQANANGLIIGVSGGVDSATTAALLKRAGPINNRYYFLSCQSVKQDMKDAQLVAQSIGFQLEVVDILPLYALACATIKANPAEDPTPLHLMNLKAMLRMTFLATLANKYGLLIAGTGNRSEMEHAGFFTKRGDGASDIVVLGHLFKRQVTKIAGLLGVPERIICRPPTPGLRILPDGTTLTDEAEMGMFYSEIEIATRLLMEFGADLKSLSDAAKGRFPDKADRILDVCRKLAIRSWRNRHKLDPTPVAGHPQSVDPVFNEYPRGFPDVDSLTNWSW